MVQCFKKMMQMEIQFLIFKEIFINKKQSTALLNKGRIFEKEVIGK